MHAPTANQPPLGCPFPPRTGFAHIIVPFLPLKALPCGIFLVVTHLASLADVTALPGLTAPHTGLWDLAANLAIVYFYTDYLLGCPPPPPPPPRKGLPQHLAVFTAGTAAIPEIMPTFSSGDAGLTYWQQGATATRLGTVGKGKALSAGLALPHLPSMFCKGPYNPAAVLPTIAKRILDLEVVEMSDTPSTTSIPTPQDNLPPSSPADPEHLHLDREIPSDGNPYFVRDSCRNFVEAPELFAYQALIVWAERNFDDRQWPS